MATLRLNRLYFRYCLLVEPFSSEAHERTIARHNHCSCKKLKAAFAKLVSVVTRETLS